MNDREYGGRATSLSYAAFHGYEWAVNFLINVSTIDADAPEDHYLGNTTLIGFAERGYDNIVKILIDSGKVGVNKSNSDGKTALMVAKEGGHEKVVQLILGSSQVTSAKVETEAFKS